MSGHWVVTDSDCHNAPGKERKIHRVINDKDQTKLFSFLIARSSSLEVTTSWCVSTNIFYILTNRYMCTFFFQNLTDFKMTCKSDAKSDFPPLINLA